MSARCVECGTPLDEVPLVECAAHRAYADLDPPLKRYMTEWRYCPEPVKFKETIDDITRFGRKLISFAPAHGFAGYYYFVLELPHELD